MLRRTALIAAAGAALVLAGCGDEGPGVPREDAAELRVALLEAKRRLSPLRCDDLATKSIPKLEDRLAALPEDTDDGVRRTIEDGIDHLRALIEAECADRQDEKDETTTTEEETTTTTEPPTTTTEPPTTTTEPPTTTTQPPPTTQPDPDPDPDPNPDPGGGGRGVPDGSIRPGKDKKDKG